MVIAAAVVSFMVVAAAVVDSMVVTVAPAVANVIRRLKMYVEGAQNGGNFNCC